MHASLLHTFLAHSDRAAGAAPVLDLACGGGRNGLYLVQQGIPVVFADRRRDQLDEIAAQTRDSNLATFWPVDFEEADRNPLQGRSFGAILVFRYLHRPLLAPIREAIQPGGLIVYETFTADQPRYGRPGNPDYLLRPGELRDTFGDWDGIHYFEGVTTSETSGREQAIAQIVARKPRT